MASHGMHVVTGSWDKTLILWDIEHAELVRMYDGHSEGTSSSYSIFLRSCSWNNLELMLVNCMLEIERSVWLFKD